MSASLDPNSADSEPEKSQVQPLSWPSIIFDESKMEEIGNNKDNPPQIIEVAKTLLKVSGGIKAIMIPLCLLARKTNPLLSSMYRARAIKKISSGL